MKNGIKIQEEHLSRWRIIASEVEQALGALALILVMIVSIGLQLPILDSVNYSIEKSSTSITSFRANPDTMSFWDAHVDFNPFDTSKSSSQRFNISIVNSTTSEPIKNKIVYAKSTIDYYSGGIKFGGRGPIRVEVKYQKYRDGEWDTIDDASEELPYK